MRFNTGLPANAINGRTWPTNWNLQGNATCAPPRTGLNFGLDNGAVPRDPDHELGHQRRRGANPIRTSFRIRTRLYRFFRFSAMGERGERNVLRGDSYASVDLAFNKAFNMPYAEAHNLAVRLEIFNLTNTPYFDTASLNLSLEDPATFGTVQRNAGRATAHAGISAVRLLIRPRTSAPGLITGGFSFGRLNRSRGRDGMLRQTVRTTSERHRDCGAPTSAAEHW